MTSPIPPSTSEHGTSMHHLITPTARIFTAAVILFTGAGVAAVFWKMPTSADLYELCHTEIVDKNLVAMPLPSEAVASIAPEEMQQIVLPPLNLAPVADTGVAQYGQVYETPPALVMPNVETVPEELVSAPVCPEKFEPVRHIVEKKPIAVESIDREFPSKPVSVNTAEKSDELLPRFHFAENSRADFEASDSAQPADPFPMLSPIPSASAPTLQPLQPLQSGGLTPLLPLQEHELPSLSALTTK